MKARGVTVRPRAFHPTAALRTSHGMRMAETALPEHPEMVRDLLLLLVRGFRWGKPDPSELLW